MKRRIVAFAFYLAIGVCLVLAAKVTTDYDHAVNFEQYRTYSWLKVQAGDPLWPDRIRSAVDSQLTKKGWMAVPAGGDADVSAFGSTREQPRLETFYTGLDGGWY